MSDVNPLLSTRTVQGAAGAVESLLDQGKINKPTTTQTQEAKADKVVQEEKTEEAKPTQEATETKTEEQPQSETQSEETQKVEDQVKASEAENAEETQVTDLHQVTVNGEKIDVNLDELKAGYQKDADYRRKTEELAIEKRQLTSDKDRLTKDYSTKLENLNNLTATLNAEASSELNSKELDKLFDEDPNEAAKIERKIRRRKETIAQAQRKLRTQQQEQFQSVLREEQMKVRLKHPDFGDPVKGATLQTNLRNYMVNRGFNDKEIAGIYDSRIFDVVLDGMSHRNNMNRPKPNLAKKIVKPTQVVKPGVKVNQDEKMSQMRLDKINRLKKSGNPRDAVDLLTKYM
ncbi:MAG TPA: hypothetical protein EYN08_02770 [Gammaproteobacteria bacterium]|nr:hypothetical protein [Gammaproteobacteria bacterium]